MSEADVARIQAMIEALAYIAFVGATRVYLLWISSPCIDAPDSCPRKHH